MSNVQETLLPAAMVPGLVTIRGKKSKKEQNVYPVDAKELIASGDYELVENGAIEAARLAATPLRSGMAANIPDNLIVAEVAGINGSVITASTPEEAEKVKESGADADGNTGDKREAPSSAREQDRQKAAESAAQGKKDEGKTAGGPAEGRTGGQASGSSSGGQAGADKK